MRTTHTLPRLCLLLLALAPLPSFGAELRALDATARHFRTWTSRAGSHTTRAAMAASRPGAVQLVDELGKSSWVPLEQLAEIDLGYVAGRTRHPDLPNVIEGRTVGITDGDTIAVLDSSKTQHKIRLEGIDTSEKGQALGAKARQAVAQGDCAMLGNLG